MARGNLAFTFALAFIAVSAAAGCSQLNTKPTPDFYPNTVYVDGGPEKARIAEQQCISLANEYVKEPNVYKDAAISGATDAAIGAGVGAIGGVIMKGSVGRATAAGAAIGGILGVLKSAKDSGDLSPSYERFVEHCLQKQGYETIGWSKK